MSDILTGSQFRRPNRPVPTGQQLPDGVPLPEGISYGTGLLLAPRDRSAVLAHMPEPVWDLSTDTHIRRLLDVLLGDAGTGGLLRRVLVARLATVVSGSRYFDSDRFYGALFGVARNHRERLVSLNPNTPVATPEQWEAIHRLDSMYRARMQRFARALQFGASALGAELIAEALLGVDVDLLEGWRLDDVTPGSANRSGYSLVARRPLTSTEEYDVARVVERITPSHAIPTISGSDSTISQSVSVYRWWSPDVDSEIVSVLLPNPSLPSQGEHLYGVNLSAGSAELPRPDGAQVRGGTWSLIRDVLSVSSHAETWSTNGWEIRAPVNHLAGQTPTMALRSAARARSAQAASHLSSTVVDLARDLWTPDTFGTAPGSEPYQAETGTLYVGGVPVDRAAGATLLVDAQDAGTYAGPMRYWASGRRLATDRTREVVQVYIREPRLVNRISLRTSVVPHRLWVEVLSGGQWTRVATETVTECTPREVSSSGEHTPQRWREVTAYVPRLRVERIRVVAQRDPDAEVDTAITEDPRTGPWKRTSHGLARAAYSIAIRDLDLSYVVSSALDLPRDNGSFARVTDMFGSDINLSVRRTPPDNLDDPESQSVWRSPPSPVSDAVACLYLEVGNPAIQPPLVDHFESEPITIGPGMAIYHSNEPVARVSDDRPLPYVLAGDTEIVPTGLRLGVNATMEVPGTEAPLLTNREWWMVFRVVTTRNNDSGAREWWRAGDWSLGVDLDGYVVLSWTYGQVRTLAPFAPGQQVVAVAQLRKRPNTTDVFDIELRVKVGQQTFEVSQSLAAPPSGKALVLRLGDPAGNPGVIVNGLSGGAGVLDSTTLSGLLNGSVSVTVPNRFDHDPFEHNQALRLDPGLRTETDTLGFRGGLRADFESLKWTPIPRDYVLVGGTIHVPPTRARFWKFEFTDLSVDHAEPHVAFRTIRRHKYSSPYEGNRFMGALAPGEHAAMLLGEQFGVDPGVGSRQSNANANTALYATDADAREALRGQSAAWGWQPWHPRQVPPKFTSTQVHEYDVEVLPHTTRVGFFVGLSHLAPAYSDPSERDDRAGYKVADLGSATDTNTWLKQGSWLRSEEQVAGSSGLPAGRYDNEESPYDASLYDRGEAPSDPYAVVHEAVSLPYRSLSYVEGVQFATRQTPARQMLPDDDLRDPVLSIGRWTDATSWHAFGDALLRWQAGSNSVRVRRYLDPTTASTGVLPGIPQPQPAPVFATRKVIFTPGDGGGLASPPVNPTPGSRVYGACRVTVPSGANTPTLWLQIVTADGATLLTEAPIQAAPGAITEWTVGHTLGSIEGVDDSSVRVRVVHRNAQDAVFDVDALSLFDDAITWDFSVDDGVTWIPALDVRNHPRGVLTFPEPGRELRWRVRGRRTNLHLTSLQLRPHYVSTPRTDLSRPVRGPNLSTYDHLLPPTKDPEFDGGVGPVPKWWYLRYRPPELAEAPFRKLRSAISLGGVITGTNRTAWYHRYPASPGGLISGVSKRQTPAGVVSGLVSRIGRVIPDEGGNEGLPATLPFRP